MSSWVSPARWSWSRARGSRQFFQEPRVESVIYLLSIGIFVQGFENIGVVDFRKNMTFGKEFGFQLVKKVPRSFSPFRSRPRREYWALVIGSVAGRVLCARQLRVASVSSAVSSGKGALDRALLKWMLMNNALFVARQSSPTSS
jgi:hypothetical protein